jgi:hypothetical protein
MSRQIINVGSANLAGDGEPLRSALIKVNENFEEVYNNIDAIEIPTDISELTDAQGLLGQGGTVDLSITVLGNPYKGFGARYGRVYGNSSSSELTVNKIVIFKEAAETSSTIHPTSSQDDFSVTGLADSDVIAMFVLYGDTNSEKSIDTLKAFARTAIDTVILAGGVEGSVNTIAAMRSTFYNNIETLTAAAGGLVENFEFFPDSNNTDIWPENNISDGGNDQYDTANYINTNLAQEISYNSGEIVEDAETQFGTGSKYVVVYSSSIFGIFATGSSATSISTSGNSGADGNSTTDTGELFATDRTYDPALTNLTLTNNPLRATPINFVKLDNATFDNVDIIEDDSTLQIGITRDVNNGIYNPFTEEEWNEDVSPQGTLWSVGNTDDLSNIESRTYTNFYAAYGSGQLGNRVPGSTAIMYVPSIEKYYLIQWNNWTQNNAGGGFSYTRTEIDVTQVEQGLRFSDGSVLKSAEGLGRVKSTASGNRRIEEVAGYKEVGFTSLSYATVTSVASRAGVDTNIIYVPNPSEVYNIANNYSQYVQNVEDIEFSLDNTTWYRWNGSGTVPEGEYGYYFIENPTLNYNQGDTVYLRYQNGGLPVVWWDKAELPGGAADFRGAVIDYHAYTGDGTIIGTIHIVDDSGERHISHTEVASGGSNGENDDLWLVQNEGTISYRRIDGEAKTLKVHWTAKVFYGSEYYD